MLGFLGGKKLETFSFILSINSRFFIAFDSFVSECQVALGNWEKNVEIFSRIFIINLKKKIPQNYSLQIRFFFRFDILIYSLRFHNILNGWMCFKNAVNIFFHIRIRIWEVKNKILNFIVDTFLWIVDETTMNCDC